MPVELLVEPQRSGFITGSRAYGQPNAESDVDLVLFVDGLAAFILTQQSETKEIPVRYGNLNLILCHSEEEYDAWEKFTQDMIEKARTTGVPVSSDEAKEVFRTRRIRCGSGSKAD